MPPKHLADLLGVSLVDLARVLFAKQAADDEFVAELWQIGREAPLEILIACIILGLWRLKPL